MVLQLQAGGRLWLNDGSCVRRRPERPNHVWAYDFVEDRTRDGRKLRMLNVVDEFVRECLAIRVSRKLGASDVIDVLFDLFILRGTPGHVRSDNGPEFAATAVKGWITGVGARTAFIEPGGSWENGYRNCQEFRVGRSIVGMKETPYGPTERASDPGYDPGPVAGRCRCQNGLRVGRPAG